MGVLDILRGRRSTPEMAPQTVKCPLCGEMNPASGLLCTICRGPLPPRVNLPGTQQMNERSR